MEEKRYELESYFTCVWLLFFFILVQWWLFSIICYVVITNNAPSAGFEVNENMFVCESWCLSFTYRTDNASLFVRISL